MPLLIANSRDDESLPLFAPLFHEKESEASNGNRAEELDTALRMFSTELVEDHFTEALGKFREALVLSQNDGALQERVELAAIIEAGNLVRRNWRIAEALLFEVGEGVAPVALLNDIEQQRREHAIEIALEESERAEQAAYLPHLHARLSDVARQYPGETRLDSRLNAINALLAQRLAEERDKNLTRLILFRDGLDACDNPATLRDFHSLVTPISCSYAGDPAFEAVLDDIQSMYDTYENALSLMAENRTRESLRLCDQVLEQRNSNRLFLRLRERVKSREWVALLAESTVQRAHAFEQNGQYGEALEEWESLRTIDPSYPGLDSEILNCAALKERAGDFHSLPKETFLSEITETEPAAIEPPAFVDRSQAKALPLGFKIAITQDAWNHLKTGLAATIALLLVVLLLASNFRH